LWLADQLLLFKPWLLRVLDALSSKNFLIVSGFVVFSAVAGSYHFYYKPPPAEDEIPKTLTVPTYDPIICIICSDQPRSHMFVPCGHMVTCSKCTEFFSNQERDCPMCRNVIMSSVKVHLS